MKAHVLSMLAMIVLLGADVPKEAEVPELNKKVLEFAQANLGKKVGDGECATLAARALRTAGARRSSATRDGEYVWGKLVRTVTPGKNLTGDVLPGDIVQFRGVVLVGKEGGNTIEYTYPHHTSIVSAVKNDGQVVEVLHQNVGDSRARDEDRRKVQRATLRLGDLKKGSLKIYRPQPRAVEKK
jgi:hypothetical protein